jgi:hypothetical protein
MSNEIQTSVEQISPPREVYSAIMHRKNDLVDQKRELEKKYKLFGNLQTPTDEYLKSQRQKIDTNIRDIEEAIQKENENALKILQDNIENPEFTNWFIDMLIEDLTRAVGFILVMSEPDDYTGYLQVWVNENAHHFALLGIDPQISSIPGNPKNEKALGDFAKRADIPRISKKINLNKLYEKETRYHHHRRRNIQSPGRGESLENRES